MKRGLGAGRQNRRAIWVEVVNRLSQIVENGLTVADFGQRGRIDRRANMRQHLSAYLFQDLAQQHRLTDASAELGDEVKDPAVLAFEKDRHHCGVGVRDQPPGEKFPW